MRVVNMVSGSVGTIRSASASDGGIFTWDNLVQHDQSHTDYGRSSEVPDSCQTLECGQSLWENGKMYDMFSEFLHNDSFAKHWYYDSEGNKLCTLLKKRNPIMETIRNCSLGEAVMSLVA